MSSGEEDKRELLLLRSGNAEVGVAPMHGCALTHWKVQGLHLLRPCRTNGSDPLESACFIMAPFSNVIEGCQFKYGERFFWLAPNHPSERLPIHGDAWLGRWTVDRILHKSLESHYAHDSRKGYPFSYRVRQTIELADGELKISLKLFNTDLRPMPAGLGIHPYFRRPAGTLLCMLHSGRWTGSAVVADRRFLSEEELPKETIDDCFVGWTQFAVLRWPQAGVQLSIQSSASASALVVFSPANADFVCVEPVSHVNDGINAHARGIGGTGVQMLEPEGSLELKTMIRVDIGEASPLIS